MFKIIIILLLILPNIANATINTSNRIYNILYIIDDDKNILKEGVIDEKIKYKNDNKERIEILNNKLKNIIHNSINGNYEINSSIINFNLDVVAKETTEYTTEIEGDSGVRTKAVRETNYIFEDLFEKIDSKAIIHSTNSNEYNYFINLLTSNLKYNNPDFIVIMVGDINEDFSQSEGQVGTSMFSALHYTNYNQVLDEALNIRKSKTKHKFVTVKKSYNDDGLGWLVMHEMGHTFSLYHDPMTMYAQSFIDDNSNESKYGYRTKSWQKEFDWRDADPIKDYIFSGNAESLPGFIFPDDLRKYGYFHPEGKGFLYSDGQKEYYSIMAYPHMGRNWNNKEDQISLNRFTDPVKLYSEFGILMNDDTVPYGRFTDENEKKYYNNYKSIKVNTSSNTSSIVQKYLLELTNDSLPDVVNSKLENYDYEIRNLKKFNDKVIISEIITDSSQNIIHTSLLDNTYKLGSDNVVYLSTGNDNYDVNNTEGNIFIIEENEIQDLMDLSLEQTSKTIINNFNSKSKLFIPSGGLLDVCLKIPSYEKYKELNSLYQTPDQDDLIYEYEELLYTYSFFNCEVTENNSDNFIVVFKYNNKSIEIEISPKSGFNKLLVDKYQDNIYRDNNPLGNPQLLPKEEYKYDYYEFTIMKIQDRFSDTVDENDDNDKNILPTHPSTKYQDNITGSDGNDIIGNPDFNSDEWINHQRIGDTYNPKGGNDFIYGTPYSDTYIFNSDFGLNVVYDRAAIDKETSYNNSGSHVNDYDLIHLTDLNISDVVFERHQYDLVITSMIRENNIIIVEDFFKVTDVVWPYQYEANQIEFFKFANGDIKTAEEITDTINNVTNTYGDNILWGNIDTNNTFNPIEGKNEYVGGLKKDKYILDINNKEIITIRDRGGYDTLYIKSDENLETARLNFVKNGDDLNIYYKYKKLAIIKDNFAEDFYKERNIEDLEYMDYNEYRPENNYMINRRLKDYGYLISQNGNPNQTFEDPAEIFKRYENIEYFKPGIGNDIFEKIKGGDVIILNLNEGMKTINTFEEN